MKRLIYNLQYPNKINIKTLVMYSTSYIVSTFLEIAGMLPAVEKNRPEKAFKLAVCYLAIAA